ncbi:pilus assembly protein PilM [Candidatus Uhrbacteria bacterium]|nr:pilus assembly protein PilM [Candidatus Uhrbacteria bacterium]
MFTWNGFGKQYALGIDCSDSGVKMLLAKKQSGHITLLGHAEAPFPSGAHRDERVQDVAACANTIGALARTLKKKYRVRDVSVVASISDAHTQMALVTLPHDLLDTEHILAEAEKNIPLHADTTTVDWQIVKEVAGQATVFVLTVPRAIGDTLTQTLEMANCFPEAIESEAVALARLIGTPTPKETPVGRHSIIDLGEHRTMFLLCENDIPLFTLSLPFTGQMLTETIAKTLKLSTEEAEKTKQQCGFDDNACKGALREVVRGHCEEAIEKIRAAIDEATAEGAPPPTHITLVGGGAHLKNIDAVFTKELGITVSLPALATLFPESSGAIPNNLLAWSVTLGLVVRGLL